MEKMYTREDVVRLLAAERDRCLNILNGKINDLERQSRRKPALKVSNGRAAVKLCEVLKDLLGTTAPKGAEYGKLLMDICEKDWFGNVPKVEKVPIDAVVFPSDERTIQVVKDEEYGGAHCYIIRECLGYVCGETAYADSSQVVQFIQKLDDGDIIPGLQSEQLVLVLIDRHRKLNARFPSEQNEKMIRGLEMFLEASRERVRDRINCGVMGELKK